MQKKVFGVPRAYLYGFILGMGIFGLTAAAFLTGDQETLLGPRIAVQEQFTPESLRNAFLTEKVMDPQTGLRSRIIVDPSLITTPGELPLDLQAGLQGVLEGVKNNPIQELAVYNVLRNDNAIIVYSDTRRSFFGVHRVADIPDP